MGHGGLGSGNFGSAGPGNGARDRGARSAAHVGCSHGAELEGRAASSEEAPRSGPSRGAFGVRSTVGELDIHECVVLELWAKASSFGPSGETASVTPGRSSGTGTRVGPARAVESVPLLLLAPKNSPPVSAARVLA